MIQTKCYKYVIMIYVNLKVPTKNVFFLRTVKKNV